MNSSVNPNEIPALQPPPGVVPNFVDPPTTATALVPGLAVMIAIATIGFVARIFTKVWVMRKMHVEDYFLVLGWIFFILCESTSLAQMPFSAGRHQWNVNLVEMEDFLRFLYFSEIFYCPCMLFTKLAILWQIKQIFHGTKKDSVWWISVSLMIINTIFYVAALIVEILICVPPEKFWVPMLQGSCINNNSMIISSASLNMALDILIFILPIYAIYRLQIDVRQKVGIFAIFAVGLLACVSSILRVYFGVNLVNATDATYEITYLAWPTCLESMAAIIVVCCPVMPRLYRYIRNERSGSSSGRPSFPSPFASGSGIRHKRLNFGKLSHMSSSRKQTNDDETHINGEWVPLEEGRDPGLSSSQPLDSERRNVTNTPETSNNYNIRKTVKIESQFSQA